MGSLLDLGPRARRVLATGYGLALVAAIASGQLAPDHVFGFQMFNESSNLEIHLFREVLREGRTELVPVPDGVWVAPDTRGVPHRFSWEDRVRAWPIRKLGTFLHASYGLDAQLYRLERALEDVARHVPEDRETRAFVAVVETVRNGRGTASVRLRAERP